MTFLYLGRDSTAAFGAAKHTTTRVIVPAPRWTGTAPVRHDGLYVIKQRLCDDGLMSVAGTIVSIVTSHIEETGTESVTRIQLRDKNGRTWIVYTAPERYLRKANIELENGQEIRVDGAYAEVNSRTAILASKVTLDGQTYELRDERGQHHR